MKVRTVEHRAIKQEFEVELNGNLHKLLTQTLDKNSSQCGSKFVMRTSVCSQDFLDRESSETAPCLLACKVWSFLVSLQSLGLGWVNLLFLQVGHKGRYRDKEQNSGRNGDLRHWKGSLKSSFDFYSLCRGWGGKSISSVLVCEIPTCEKCVLFFLIIIFHSNF